MTYYVIMFHYTLLYSVHVLINAISCVLYKNPSLVGAHDVHVQVDKGHQELSTTCTCTCMHMYSEKIYDLHTTIATVTYKLLW